jgi:hypothetical protein
MVQFLNKQLWRYDSVRTTLLSMSRWLLLVSTVAIIVPGAVLVSAQVNSSKGEAILSKLSPPVYPPVARGAHISGDVELAIQIWRDGSVESAQFVSGNSLFVSSSMGSAKRSQFECRQCSDAVTLYPLTYQFRIAPRDPPKDCNGEDSPPPPTSLDLSKHQVTVSVWEFWTCDPAVQLQKVRSAKCLYLWKCGVSEP